MWQAARVGVKVWKGGLLPLVVTDLDEGVKRRAEGAMEDLDALECRVVLENEGKGNSIFRVP